MLFAMGFLFFLTVALVIRAAVNFFRNKKKRKIIMNSTENSLIHAKKIVEALFFEYAQYLFPCMTKTTGSQRIYCLPLTNHFQEVQYEFEH